MTSTLETRAKGTAFEVLYAPRAEPNTATPPKKRGPKPRIKPHQATGPRLMPLTNSAPGFNTPLATQASLDRSQAIKRSPSTC